MLRPNYCLLLGLSVVSCGRFGFETSAEDDGGSPLIDARAIDATAIDATAIDARQQNLLGPLVEYRFTMTSEMVVDSAPDPIDLGISVQNGSPTFGDPVGQHGRHLRFSGTPGEATGRVRRNVDNTKLDVLHGARQVTLEAKYSVVDCGSSDASTELRVLGISTGDLSDDYWLGMRADDGTDLLALRFNDTKRWNQYKPADDCPAQGAPTVMHWVVDTTAIEEDRIRVFRNGIRLPMAGSSPLPLLNATIDLGPDERRLWLGCPYDGFRTLRGNIYYAAIYNKAITESEISSRVQMLQNISDD